MSDRMTLIPFDRLMLWILKKKMNRVLFWRASCLLRQTPDKTLPIFTEKIETPFGPAAGPNTQLAHKILWHRIMPEAVSLNSRPFQILDGEDLPVNKPCILADDECYNCEWSTELRVLDAF